jgi:DNA-binding GntR family transcriptional regulator
MVKKENLKVKAYGFIKNKIVNCEYAPASFLNEMELIQEIGASRTPIREALNKLEQENLIRIIPKKGVIVNEITVDEINDIYQIRELIEPYIIRVWGRNLDTDSLIEYRDRLQQLNTAVISRSERFSIDDNLHRRIISVCSNKYLMQLIENCYDQNHRIRIIAGKTERRLDLSNEEHLHILDLLIGGDLQGAAGALSNHLEEAKKAAVESLFKLVK